MRRLAEMSRMPRFKTFSRSRLAGNVGLEFVPCATIFDAAAGDAPTVNEASRIVWLDAFTLNVDRTAKNANLLMQNQTMWLIDHGASLYFHHDWPHAFDKVSSKFDNSREHILLRWATDVASAGSFAHERLTAEALRRIVDLVPDELLQDENEAIDPDTRREEYLKFFERRLQAAKSFEEEIGRVRLEGV